MEYIFFFFHIFASQFHLIINHCPYEQSKKEQRAGTYQVKDRTFG